MTELQDVREVLPTGVAFDGQPHGTGFTRGLGLVVSEVKADTTEFFRPVRECRLDVAAQPVHQGRTQQVWEVHIKRAGDGKLVARGQLRLQHVDRRAAPHGREDGSSSARSGEERGEGRETR